MLSFILATGNLHKAEEFKELFQGTIHIRPAPKTLEVDESGKTFFENAYLKSKTYFETYGAPALADDSGLVVNALPDQLGVLSARFAPELKEYSEKCKRLIELLEGREDRSAHFVCVLCFYLGPEEVYFFEGRVQGMIGTGLRGEYGFGYDPIFIPERKEQDGKSLAELPEWKNMFSHRAKASLDAIQFFKDSMDKTFKKS